eukprot:221040-Rhodomonas_salina.1
MYAAGQGGLGCTTWTQRLPSAMNSGCLPCMPCRIRQRSSVSGKMGPESWVARWRDPKALSGLPT